MVRIALQTVVGAWTGLISIQVRRSRSRTRLGAGIMLAFASAGTSPAIAANYFWQDDAGTFSGNWSASDHWSPAGPPPSGNSAIISVAPASAYTITLDVNPTGLQSFTQNSADATLAGGAGHTISFSGGASINLTRGALTGSITFNLTSGVRTLALTTSGIHTGNFHVIQGGFGALTLVADKLVAGRTIDLISVGGGGGTAELNGQDGLINQSTIKMAGAHVALIRVPGTLVNQGTVLAQAPSTNLLSLQLDNTGVLDVLQTTVLGGDAPTAHIHTNHGTINVAADEILFLNGASFNQAGGLITVNGLLTNEGNFNGLPLQTFLQTGGTFAFGVTTGGFKLLAAGQHVNLQAGMITGNPVIDFSGGGSLTLTTDGTHTGDFKVIVRPGPVTLVADKLVAGRTIDLISVGGGGGTAELRGQAGLINQSIINMTGAHMGLIRISGTLVNQGTIIAQAPSTNLLSLQLHNTGVLDVLQTTVLGGDAPTAHIHTNHGTINVAADEILFLNGASFNQAGGQITVNGLLTNEGNFNGLPLQTFLQTGGLVNVSSTGSMQFISGAARFNGGVTQVANGGRLIVTNSASLSLGGGTIDLSLGGTATVGNGSVETTASTFRIRSGAVVRGSGTIIGTVMNDGGVAPGLSPGILKVQGNYRQSGAASLEVELAGSDNSNPLAPQHDVLQVTGTGTLGGNINLAAINDYNPAYLVPHEIITAGSISRTFESVTGFALSPTKYLVVSYDADSVFVTAAIPGDANLEGKVDVADLGTLATNWQSQGVWATGDFDQNRFVEVNDLGLLASNWQAGVGTPLGPSLEEALASLGLPSVSVPEPGGLGLLMTVALKRHHRSRRRRCAFNGV